MGRKAMQPAPGKNRPVKVQLSLELKSDLWAFCEVHHGTPQNRVIEKAVRAFIEADLERHPTLVPEWKTLRDRVRAKPELVEFPKSSED